MNRIFNAKYMRLFSAAICLMLSIVMVFTLCSCKKNPDDEASSDMAYSLDDSSMTDLSEADSTDSSETTDSSEDTTSSTDADVNSSATSDGSSAPAQSVVQLPTATNPEGEEILGSGTKDDPYLEIPTVSDNFMSVTTVNIPAGKTIHYGIGRVVGTILTIENSNAYVIYNNTRYDAQGGKVTFEVVDVKALASDYIKFEIGNNGSAAASFKLIFTNKTGSRENPTVIKNAGADNTVSLEADNSAGHYYKYISEKAGKLRFYISADVDSVISVTDNSTSKNIIGNYAKSTAQLTDPDKGDVVVEYIELEVTAGAEIIISVGSTPNKRGKYPAANITWSCKYA